MLRHLNWSSRFALRGFDALQRECGFSRRATRVYTEAGAHIKVILWALYPDLKIVS